jgi:hypothetical protein
MANQLLPGVNTIPNSLVITAITRALPMVVTTTLASLASPNPRVNTYQIGMNVKLTVPITYGMFQANGLMGTIIAISGNMFTLALDSSQFDAFSVPVNQVDSPASLAPFGSRNVEYNNSTNIAFESLNNIGN